MSKTITVSDYIYEYLLKIKNETQKKRKSMRENGYTTEEINEECPPASFDGAIGKMIYDISGYELDAEHYEIERKNPPHCMNCCPCDQCVQDRYDRAQAEYDQASW